MQAALDDSEVDTIIVPVLYSIFFKVKISQ